MKRRRKITSKTYIDKNNFKICTICERPYSTPGKHCCKLCKSKIRELNRMIDNNGYKYGISIAKIVYLKEIYKVNDIFDYLKSDLRKCYTGNVSYKDRMEFKRNIRKEHRESKQIEYKKWEDEIPFYVYQLINKHQTKELLTISGNKYDPFIHYVCKRCNEEQAQLYSEMLKNKSHDCVSNKSRGEVLVESYLNKRYKIKTQRDTLMCINPVTNRQLPYDFEIPSINTIIEVQGEQHLKFIPYFHGSIDNFHYQQRKDSYKKRFAEKKGYKVVYIYYDELKDNKFIQKLKSLGI